MNGGGAPSMLVVLDGDGQDLLGMGYAQRLELLGEVMDAISQRLATQFEMDAKSMALTLSTVQNKWVMSIDTDVVLR